MTFVASDIPHFFVISCDQLADATCYRIQSVDRCYVLDETLARLARVHPNTKFIRSRAAALGFATTPSLSVPLPSRARSETDTARSHINEDDDDPYADDSYDVFGEVFITTFLSSQTNRKFLTFIQFRT